MCPSNEDRLCDLNGWIDILGDTPERFDCDGSISLCTTQKTLDASAVTRIKEWCKLNEISPFVFALHVTHHTLRTYSHAAYALGVAHPGVQTHLQEGEDGVATFVNTVLVPFQGGSETVKELYQRWKQQILPRASTPFSAIENLGYGCNIRLVFNVPSELPRTEETKQPLGEARTETAFDLSIFWVESEVGSWTITFESMVGEWDLINERLIQAIDSDLADQRPESLLPLEREQVLAWGEGTSSPIPDLCIHELFEGQVLRRPDAVAFIDDGKTTSYRELDCKANNLAIQLQKHGVKPDSFVALMLDRSVDMIVGILGILKAGGAYVPIDPTYPEERIKYVLGDAGVTILVTQIKYFRDDMKTCICMENMQINEREGIPERTVRPHNLSYMIYTSGTTGRPKGVMCEHRGVVNMVQAHSPSFSSADVVALVFNFVFDGSVDAIFSTLSTGGALTTNVAQCTILLATPSHVQVLGDCNPRLLTVMGEPCPKYLEESFPALENIYGPAECTVYVTLSNKASTIGKPIQNTQCYVVHPDDGTLCPPGVSGELWLGGAGVARGYHNRQDLTAQKFVPNPFGDGRVYKTGDRVSWNSDGELLFLGRFDHQVKVRGFRIELMEVEHVLQSQEGVSGAVVVVNENRLVAYVTPACVDEGALTTALYETLPSYMVPSKIIAMQTFPLTPNGKLDRKKLPIPVFKSTEAFAPPTTKDEAAMCAIWEDILGVDSVGIHANFFELGGHSLLAMQIAQRTSFSVSTIMSNPTVSCLLRTDPPSQRNALSPTDELTHAERRMLYIHLSEPSNSSYNIPFRFHFGHGIDLRQNLRRVIDGTPILRTRFHEGKAVADVEVPIQDEIDVWAPFDLQNGPLCRFAVKENVLTACVHHSVADGRSVDILVRQLADDKHAISQQTVRHYAALEGHQSFDTSSWEEVLGDTPDRFEHAKSSSTFHCVQVCLDKVTTKRVQTWCKEKAITPFAFALHATHHIMRAYNHSPFALSTVYDVRPPEFQDSVGMFANTVLIPFKSGDETAQDLQRQWVQEILPRATTPYDKVVEMGYGSNVHLAFNIGLDSFESRAATINQFHELPFDHNPLPKAKFDISFIWSNSDEGGWEILVESGVGEWNRINERVEQVVGSILADQPPLAVLDNEIEQCLAWGKGPSDPIPDICIHELFEAQVLETPTAVALIHGHRTTSYQELDNQSTMLAHRLQRRGVTAEVLVGIMMDKSFDLIAGILGILKAGGAYVPIDPTFPEERKSYILRDSGVKILVTKGKYRRFDVETCVYRYSFDNSCTNRDLAEKVNSRNLAYMIYTSGTTGRPKGVMVEHGSVVNMLKQTWPQFDKSGPQDVVALLTNVVFDMSVHPIFAALGSGSALSLDLTNECTQLWCTPSYAKVLLEGSSRKLKYLNVGGEAACVSLEEKCEHLRNWYGPTECTVTCIMSCKASTIGKPITNTMCYVVHPDDGSLCPPGISGELLIGGSGVTRGYHNRYELTAEKFIPNRFGQGRVYKTGDRVMWNEDGELVYLGRFDDQVKIRGYRVELGEVETALQRQPGVVGAAVVTYGEKLVGYVIPTGVSQYAVMAALKTTLPAYMVPSKIVCLESFPLTRNGKIDRKALPSPDFKSDHYTEPRNDSERRLSEIFGQVLGIKHVGIDDDFFALGGHSLQVIHAVRLIREQIQRRHVSVREFINAPSVRKLSEYLGSYDDTENPQDATNSPDSIDERKPDENSQEEWFCLCSILVKACGVFSFSVILGVCFIPLLIHLQAPFEKPLQNWSDVTIFVGIYISVGILCFFLLAIATWILGKVTQKCLIEPKTVIHPLSGEYVVWYVYDRLWLFTGTILIRLFGGTLWLSTLYRIYGATIGAGVLLEDSFIRMPSLVFIGSGCVIETEAMLETVRFLRNGTITFDKIVVQQQATVGKQSFLSMGCCVGEATVVKALSYVHDTQVVGGGLLVHGVHKRRSTVYGRQEELAMQESLLPLVDIRQILWHIFAPFVIHIPNVVLIVVYVVIYFAILLHIFTGEGHDTGRWMLSALTFYALAPISSWVGSLLGGFITLALRRILNKGSAEPSDMKLYSVSFYRRWVAAKMYRESVRAVEGTVVARCITMLLGGHLDLKSIFTKEPDDPDLVSTGKNLFCAYGVIISSVSFQPLGHVRFGTVDVGDDCLLLDRAVVEPGAILKDRVIVASLTRVPQKLYVSPDTLLLGNPPLILPATPHETSSKDDSGTIVLNISHYVLLTYLKSFFIDAPMFTAVWGWAVLFFEVNLRFGRLPAAGISAMAGTVLYPGFIFWLLLTSIAIKRLIIGDFRTFVPPGKVLPRTSFKVFLWKVVQGTFLDIAGGAGLIALDDFRTTRWYWRAMGANIGRGTMIEPRSLICDADYLHIGENCKIDDRAKVFAHRFNKGGLEMAPVHISSRSSVGSLAMILAGVQVGENVSIRPLTHTMPSEHLTSGVWQGNPAEFVDEEILPV